VAVAAETVQLTGNLDRWSGQGTTGPDDHDLLTAGVQRPAARRVRAEQVGVPSGISPVENDPEVATRTLVIAVGWSLVGAKPRGRIVDHHGESCLREQSLWSWWRWQPCCG
jgi:hypothetical protein